jgi:peptide/nickel transport system permease protein
MLTAPTTSNHEGDTLRIREVARYVFRRLCTLVALLLLYSFGIFSLLALSPGNTAQLLLGAQPATPAALTSINREYHLNSPFLTQYWYWLRGAVRLDFGRSIATGQTVSSAIADRIGVTATLGLMAFFLTMVIGVASGMIAAHYRGRVADRVITAGAVVGISAPAFATGILLLYLLADRLRIFPAIGDGGSGFDRVYHLLLPAITLSIGGVALVIRYTRAAAAAVLTSDYVTFAKARGVGYWKVLFSYVLRNALIPVITSAGVILAYVLTGAVIVETTFSIPGIGSLLIQAVNQKDIPLVQGVTLLMAATIFAINLLVDVGYLVVDPRVTHVGKRR